MTTPETDKLIADALKMALGILRTVKELPDCPDIDNQPWIHTVICDALDAIERRVKKRMK